MTTWTNSAVIDHSSDAGFRAWGTEFHTGLTAIGLTNTADTGQINWTTVLRPAVGVSGGYEIWRFNDTLQATKPIYIKLEFGTRAAVANDSMIWLTIGTGTDGAGTITGTLMARQLMKANQNVGSTSTPRVSNMCYNAAAGFLGICWKRSANTSGSPTTLFFFCIMRTVDDNADPNSDGMIYLGHDGSTTDNTVSRCYSYSTSTLYDGGNAFCMITYGRTNSLVGADTQIYKHYVHSPRVRPVLQTCSYQKAELTSSSTFSLDLVKSGTFHTYMAIADAAAVAAVNGVFASHGVAMLWE